MGVKQAGSLTYITCILTMLSPRIPALLLLTKQNLVSKSQKSRKTEAATLQ
jgi:hypothetical protein